MKKGMVNDKLKVFCSLKIFNLGVSLNRFTYHEKRALEQLIFLLVNGDSSLKVQGVQTAFRSQSYMLSSPGNRNLISSLISEFRNFITN